MRAAAALLALGLIGCAPTASSDVRTGPQIFAVDCSGCHGAEGEGTSRGPELAAQAWGMSVEEVVDTVLDGSGRMEPVDLTIEEAEAVAAWVVASWL
jgi:mono/diheme cytochrome c family protein